MKAYCYRDGVIHFTDRDVPEGAIPFIACEDSDFLKRIVVMTADLHRNEHMFVVPGFDNKVKSEANLQQLIKYSRRLKDELEKFSGASDAA